VTALDKMLADTFYFLLKDYGTVIQFKKIGKADIDPETGVRSEVEDKIYPISCVYTPIGVMVEFIGGLVGRTERQRATDFLVLTSELPSNLVIEQSDSFTHANIKYTNLTTELYGTLTIISGEAVR
jgi:hypothetical protein